MLRFPGILWVLLYVLVATFDVAAQDDSGWPRFRGPDGSGVARGQESLPTELGAGKNLRWKTEVTRGHSSPCITDHRIYLTGFNDARQELETMCLDRMTGRIVWRRVAPASKVERVHDVSSPAAPTPATDGERVFVFFGSYGILCYDLDGKELWTHPIPMPDVMFGTGASPIVVKKLVILNVDQNGGSYLLALDGESGREVWKQPRPSFGRGWSTPLHVRHHGTSHIVVLGSRRLMIYGLDGAEQSSVGELPPFTMSSPTYDSGLLFLAATDEYGEPENVVQPPPFDEFLKLYDANRDGKVGRDEVPADVAVVSRRASSGAGNTNLRGGFFTSIDLDKDNTLNQDEWTRYSARMAQWPAEFQCGVFAVRLDHVDPRSSGTIVWRTTDGVPEVPSPLVYQGRIYTVKNGGILFCRNAQNGEVLFKGRLGAGGGYYASPVAGDGKVFFASDRGEVVVIKASDRLEVLSRNDLAEPIMATPAIVNGYLYIRTDKHVFAFSN